jgi:hypothetical protein
LTLRRYVYYRVREADLAPAVAALNSLPGSFELLRRPGASDGLVTLMEVHRADDAALEARCAAAVAPWLRGVRHIEVFSPLQDPPAAALPAAPAPPPSR